MTSSCSCSDTSTGNDVITSKFFWTFNDPSRNYTYWLIKSCVVAQKRGATTFISVFSRSTEFIGGKHRQLWLELLRVPGIRSESYRSAPPYINGKLLSLPMNNGARSYFHTKYNGAGTFLYQKWTGQRRGQYFWYNGVELSDCTDDSTNRCFELSKYRYIETSVCRNSGTTPSQQLLGKSYTVIHAVLAEYSSSSVYWLANKTILIFETGFLNLDFE